MDLWSFCLPDSFQVILQSLPEPGRRTVIDGTVTLILRFCNSVPRRRTRDEMEGVRTPKEISGPDVTVSQNPGNNTNVQRRVSRPCSSLRSSVNGGHRNPNSVDTKPESTTQAVEFSFRIRSRPSNFPPATFPVPVSSNKTAEARIGKDGVGLREMSNPRFARPEPNGGTGSVDID